jgi:cytochrome P450
MTKMKSLTSAGLGSFTSTVGSEPFDYYERLRALGDVVWDDNLNSWLVISHEATKEVLRNDQQCWDSPDKVEAAGIVGLDGPRWQQFKSYQSERTLNTTDTERHNHMHRWWMRTFSGRALEHLGDTLVRPVAHAQIDRFIERGSAELYEDFAYRVAPRVIASAMGLPWDDDAWLERVLALHVQRIALISHKRLLGRSGVSPDPEILAAGYAAVEELAEVARPYVRERRDGEGDDFISLVWRDADALFGPVHDENDVIATANIAFAGGSGTTAAATSAGLYLLLSQPQLQRDLRAAGPQAVGLFVEETLRLFPSLTFTARIASQDVELSGIRIKSGELVMLLTGAVNRDPEHYTSPRAVDLARRAPRDHYTFMKGPQTCPGQGLARTQLTTIFSVVLERLDQLRFDPDAAPPQYTDPFIRRWRPLNVLFSSGDPLHRTAGPEASYAYKDGQ